jgi:hypothetical protein
MLRTTIQTTDESGKELPIPADLLARVRRAADILEDMLRKVADKIDINARWWFDPEAESEPAVLLSLSVEDRAFLKPFPYPREALRDDDSIRRQLWTPIKYLLPQLDEVVDRQFESVRRGLEALATAED